MADQETDTRTTAGPAPPESPPAVADGEAGAGPNEKFARLERLLRGVGSDSLETKRTQRETLAALQGLKAQLDGFELDLKGTVQNTWRLAQESQQGIARAEEHYAGALRELEARVRDELQQQLYRNAAQAILPALDDMDLTLFTARARHGIRDGDGGLLEAMELVRAKLVEGLRLIGWDEIPIEVGVTQFDPSQHRAVEPDVPAEALADVDAPKGSILYVRRAGFRREKQVVREPHVLVKF